MGFIFRVKFLLTLVIVQLEALIQAAEPPARCWEVENS